LNNIYRLRRIAEYQFGEGIGDIIFPDDVKIEISKRTGKIKRITLKGKVLATLRPRDGMIALTVEGAKKIKEKIKPPKLRVTVMNEVAKYIRKGRNVFAKHVKDADPEIRPGSEVIIVDEEDNLLAVGKAILNGKEMIAFKSGIAVKVRRGVGE